MSEESHTSVLPPADPQQPDTVIVTPFLRVCFAVIMRMFMDHQQFLVYIKDSPKHPAKLSAPSQTGTLLSSYLCAFPPSTQKSIFYLTQLTTCNLLALEWVWHERRETKISFWKSHAKAENVSRFPRTVSFQMETNSRCFQFFGSLSPLDFSMQGGVRSLFTTIV